MTLLNTKVEIGFVLGGSVTSPFILDSSTNGVLGTDVLGALEFFDVSQYATSVSIKRGKSQQLDQFSAGTARVILNNFERLFDPLNVSSPYYPEIVPRRPIRISVENVVIFTGIINDWDIEYDLGKNDYVVASCSDFFSVLANITLNQQTPPEQTSGERVEYVLDTSEVDYVGGREIEVGLSLLDDFEIAANTVCINYLRDVEQAEQGILFISAGGDIVFRARGGLPPAKAVFADDGTGIKYSSLSNTYGDEFLYNRIVVESPLGSRTVRSDSASKQKFQTSTFTLDDALLKGSVERGDLASYLLSKYKNPLLKFNGVGFQMLGRSEDEIQSLLSIDLADTVTLKKSFDVGSPSSVTQFARIVGIRHEIQVGSHVVSYNLDYSGGENLLILGDPVYGKLDEGILSF